MVLRRPLRRFRCGVLVTAALLCGGAARAQTTGSTPSSAPEQQNSSEKENGKPTGPATTKIKIRVTNDAEKPIANASVYVRFYSSGGLMHHDKLQEMNFKTNQDGSVKVPEIPQGKILIQVIAPGWHTYGEWYDIDTKEESIAIKLVPPPHWY